MKTQSCESCICFLLVPESFWKDREIDENMIGAGHCRRFPPKITIIDSKINSCFPMTHKNGWCGEFDEDDVKLDMILETLRDKVN